MSETQARFQTAADVLATWRDNVTAGKPPTLFPIGTGELAKIEIGPGLVSLIGGAPGAGKTAFTMQAIFDALRMTPDIKALVCNVEMSPHVLLDRQLARLSGIDLKTIRYRRLGQEHAERIRQAIDTLAPLAERLCFLRPPFDLANVAATADAFGADLLLLDYIQRILPPGQHGDRRGAVDETMDYLRQFAENGTAVICVSAVSRGKSKNGQSSYAGDSLNLASFRESSELEFGADDAFLLVPDAETKGVVILRHVKARHGEQTDIQLQFDGLRQRFTTRGSERPAPASNGNPINSQMADLWKRTAAAKHTRPEDDA